MNGGLDNIENMCLSKDIIRKLNDTPANERTCDKYTAMTPASRLYVKLMLNNQR